MSKYSFTFKKDNIFVEFTSEDKNVVERQFQIWVADADAYARAHKQKAVKPEIKPELVLPKAEPESLKPVEHIAEPVLPVEPIEEAKTEEKTEVFEKASTLLKSINDIQSPQEEIKEEVKNFDEVLEKTLDNSTFEPIKTKDQVFLNLINSKNTTDKFHYLIITSYYLSEFEKMERFSLKQINSKLMHNLSELIDHTMLQEAINQNFIELVPDLTGVSEVGEYRLTRVGEDFFAKI